MQNIGAPAGNGHLDTILVQAEGKTGDHAERKPAFDEAMQDSGETEPNKGVELNKAQKYDGSWKGL